MANFEDVRKMPMHHRLPCENCAHLDKSEHEINDHYYRCAYPIPDLPMWATRYSGMMNPEVTRKSIDGPFTDDAKIYKECVTFKRKLPD